VSAREIWRRFPSASDDASMEVLMDLAKEVNDLQVWREGSQIVD
jgi:hypothetical protein